MKPDSRGSGGEGRLEVRDLKRGVCLSRGDSAKHYQKEELGLAQSVSPALGDNYGLHSD